ncbi:MAG: hypothetical protein AABZ94_07580 [Candidatus Eisenbacteria bacterium]
MLVRDPFRKKSLRAVSRVIRMAAVAAVLAAVACGAGGCRKKSAPPSKVDETLFKDIAKAQVRADEVFNGRDTMKIARGKWTTPGSAAGYEAYRAGEVFRFIEEREDRGEYGSSDNRYYYDETGTIFFYEDRGEEKEPRGSLPPMSRLVQRTLMFGDSGQAVWGRRLVDGAAGVVPDSQIVAIRGRANGLLAHAKGMMP